MRLRRLALLIFGAISAAVLAQSITNDASYFPVLNFQLQFIHEESEFHGGILPSGHFQPHPDVLRVQFSAAGEEYDFTLFAKKDLVGESSRVMIHGKPGESVQEVTHTLVSYTMREESIAVSCTVLSDGLVSMGIFRKGRPVLQVQPIRALKGELEDDILRDLQQESISGMVLYKTKDSRIGRKLLQDFPDATFRWDDCYSSDPDVIASITIGVAMDYGYYLDSLNYDPDNSLAQISDIFNLMNLVFEPQLGVRLVLGDLIVKTALDDDTWNQSPTAGCSMSISGLLDTFTEYQMDELSSSTMGLWHLMTDCYPPPGTVGIAYVGTMCRTGSSGFHTGVSTDSGSSTWLTVAHEVGHNFGASHSFEEGQGRTGGIMDYGDGRLNGVFQFNRQYRFDDICPTISNALTSTSRRINSDCLSLGNGAVEAPESYSWMILSDFGECSAPCGNSGIQTRQIVCVEDSTGISVSDDLCDGSSKPLEQRECNRIECEEVTTCTCSEWSEFSACSDRESGTQTRTRQCTETVEGSCETSGFFETETIDCGSDGGDFEVCISIDLGKRNLPNREVFKQRVEASMPELTNLDLHTFTMTRMQAHDSHVTFGVKALAPKPVQRSLTGLAQASSTDTEDRYMSKERLGSRMSSAEEPHALGANMMVISDCINDTDSRSGGSTMMVAIASSGGAIVLLGSGLYFYKKRHPNLDRPFHFI